MSNITTDVNSFENIDYPKSIYELLINLKDKPLDINVNCGVSSNSDNPSQNSSYNKYSSVEKLLRIDDVYGKIYTKTFYQDLECDFRPENLPNIPQYFDINEFLTDLNIFQILDFSAKLNDEKLISLGNDGTRDVYETVKNFICLNNMIYIDTNHAFLRIPTAYDWNDTSVIVNKDINPYRIFQSFVTLVYTKNQIEK